MLLTPLSFRLLLPWHKSSCATWPPARCHAKGTRGAVPSSKAPQSWAQRSCRDGFQQDFVTAPCPAEDVDVPGKVPRTRSSSQPDHLLAEQPPTRASCMATAPWAGISELKAG